MELSLTWQWKLISIKPWPQTIYSLHGSFFFNEFIYKTKILKIDLNKRIFLFSNIYKAYVFGTHITTCRYCKQMSYRRNRIVLENQFKIHYEHFISCHGSGMYRNFSKNTLHFSLFFSILNCKKKFKTRYNIKLIHWRGTAVHLLCSMSIIFINKKWRIMFVVSETPNECNQMNYWAAKMLLYK